MEAYARGSRIRMRACRALTQLSGASSFGLAKTIVGDSVDDVFPFNACSAGPHTVTRAVSPVSIPNLETASASTCLLFSVLAPATSVSDSLLDYVADAPRSDKLYVFSSVTT